MEQAEFDMEKIKALPEWKLRDEVRTPESMAAVLNEVLDPNAEGSENRAVILAWVLGELCKDQGMPSIAEKTGFARESLYKALSGKPNTRPEFNTILKVTKALGLEFKIVPINRREDDGGSAGPIACGISA
jgi:probable addiction module antidote protein